MEPARNVPLASVRRRIFRENIPLNGPNVWMDNAIGLIGYPVPTILIPVGLRHTNAQWGLSDPGNDNLAGLHPLSEPLQVRSYVGAIILRCG